jgi:hypothetical protein
LTLSWSSWELGRGEFSWRVEELYVRPSVEENSKGSWIVEVLKTLFRTCYNYRNLRSVMIVCYSYIKPHSVIINCSCYLWIARKPIHKSEPRLQVTNTRGNILLSQIAHWVYKRTCCSDICLEILTDPYILTPLNTKNVISDMRSTSLNVCTYECAHCKSLKRLDKFYSYSIFKIWFIIDRLWWIWRLPSSEIWYHIDLVWAHVSEERIASIFRVEKSASEETAWACGCRLGYFYLLQKAFRRIIYLTLLVKYKLKFNSVNFNHVLLKSKFTFFKSNIPKIFLNIIITSLCNSMQLVLSNKSLADSYSRSLIFIKLIFWILQKATKWHIRLATVVCRYKCWLYLHNTQTNINFTGHVHFYALLQGSVKAIHFRHIEM